MLTNVVRRVYYAQYQRYLPRNQPPAILYYDSTAMCMDYGQRSEISLSRQANFIKIFNQFVSSQETIQITTSPCKRLFL